MDKTLLKSLLSYDFYTANQSRLRSSLFDSDIKNLFDIIVKGHEKYGHDLSSDDLNALWIDSNPIATRAQKGEISDLIEEIEQSRALSSELASDLISGLWQRSIGKDIANLGIAISEGDTAALARVERIIEGSREGFMPDDFGEDTTTDISALLEEAEAKCKWHFNLTSLARVVPGIGPGTFSHIFATPNAGKTTAAVSFMAGPGGFCEQGARVVYIANEEKASRTMLRAVQASSGMTEKEIIEDPERAARAFKKISHLLHMRDCLGWDMARLHSYLEKVRPDILIIDQLDKLKVSGSNIAMHEQIQSLYTSARETAKKYDVALISVGQASADAVGKTRLTPDMQQNSKIGKQAELDLILGVGRYPEGSGDENMRFINIGKNKLNGAEELVVCQIEKMIGRYVS